MTELQIDAKSGNTNAASTLDIKTSPNIERSLKEIQKIFSDSYSDIQQALPAIHRIQRCFGPIEAIDRRFFIRNLTYDLMNFESISNPSETAQRATNSLEKVEMILTYTFIYDPDSLNRKAYADLQNENQKSITRTVWRSWLLDSALPQQDAIDNLYKLTMGNLRFSRLALWRNAGINHPMTDDPLKEEGQLLDDWTMIKTRAGNKGFAPGAEEQVVPRKTKREFIDIARGTILENWLKGTSIKEFSDKYGWSPDKTKKEIKILLREACEKGREIYGWTEEDMSVVLSLGEIPYREWLRDSWALNDNEMWDLFGGLDLPSLMGLIEQMEPFERGQVPNSLDSYSHFL